MNKRAPLITAGTIFLLMGLAHLIRTIVKFGIIIAGLSVPFWVSNVAAIVLFILSIWMFSAARRK